MKKMMTAVIAAGAMSATSAFAASYNLVTNDTDPVDYSHVANIKVDASANTTVTNDPNPLPVSGAWDFNFNDNGTVDFVGVVEMNKLEQYDSVTKVSLLGSMTGTITYVGAYHTINGTADWDEATRTLTYDLPSGGPNSNAGSVYKETNPPTWEGPGSMRGQPVGGTGRGPTPGGGASNRRRTFTRVRSSLSVHRRAT